MYNRLSDYYDQIFTFEESIAEKLEREFPKKEKGTLVDLACGTGTYTIHLAEKGYTLLGIDLDEEMIERAIQKISKEKGSLRERLAFRSGNMEELSSILSQNPFTDPLQGIYCLGNSLPHLPSIEKIYTFFVDVKEILKGSGSKDGRFLLQTVNFDKLPEEGEVTLPFIRNEEEGILFTRTYKMTKAEKKITFVTELQFLDSKDEATGMKSIKGEVDLVRTESNILLDAVKKAGFSDIRTYGSYKDTEYIPTESFLFILSAGIA